MNEWLVLGQLLVCLGVLAIMLGFIVIRRTREPRLDMILCATAMLIGAISLRFVGWGYAHGAHAAQAPIIQGCELMLASGATVLVVASLFLDGLSWTHDVALIPLVITLVPLVAALPNAVITGRTEMLLSALTLSLLLSYLLTLHKDEERRAQIEREAQHQHALLLQEQMRPNFVLGVLDSLHSLCETDPAAAAAGMSELSSYLRASRETLNQNQLVPFEDELGRIRQYVALEQLNPQNQFEVAYNLQTSDFCLPALTLEPLVECAVRQVERATETARKVAISTELHGEFVKVVVESTGEDIRSNMAQAQLSSRTVENVRERLATMCQATLNATSTQDGTRVVVLLPTGSKQ